MNTEDLAWQTVSKILRATAEEVCGKREKQTNLWMNQNQKEAMELIAEIREALRERYRVIRQTRDRTSQGYAIARARLTEKRQTTKES